MTSILIHVRIYELRQKPTSFGRPTAKGSFHKRKNSDRFDFSRTNAIIVLLPDA